MSWHTKVAGVWETVSAPSTRVAGVWQPIVQGYVKVAGVWETFYGSLSLSPSTANVSKTAFNVSAAYAAIEFATDGIERENSSATNNATNQSRGNWLDAGSSSDVWVQRIVTNGSLNDTDPGLGRLRLDANRTYGVRELSTNGSHFANVTFNFYDAASGGSLLATTSISLTATVTTI